MNDDTSTFDVPAMEESSRPAWPWARILHYYGDIERRAFLAAAVVMFAGMFYFHPYISMPMYLSIIAIIVLVIAAGLLSPHQRLLAIGNVFVALVGVLVFGVAALNSRAIAVVYKETIPAALPWANLVLAAIFLVALYFSVKTLRWRFTRGKIRLLRGKFEQMSAHSL